MRRGGRHREETGMDHRRFGSLDRRVSVIGQGTWHLHSAGRTAAMAALRRGLDLGHDHIDTAELGSGEAEESYRRSDRRPARRGVPGLQGDAAERLAGGHDRGLRAFAGPPEDRPARLLPAALAGRPAAGRDRRGPSMRCGPRARSCPGASATSTWPIWTRCWIWPARADRLQPGALPLAGARHRTCRDPLVRAARRRGHGL